MYDFLQERQVLEFLNSCRKEQHRGGNASRAHDDDASFRGLNEALKKDREDFSGFFFTCAYFLMSYRRHTFARSKKGRDTSSRAFFPPLHRIVSLYRRLLPSHQPSAMPPSCDTVPEADAAETKMADPKIVDLIKAREGEDQGPFTSLEFFPPRTDEGIKVRACSSLLFVLLPVHVFVCRHGCCECLDYCNV